MEDKQKTTKQLWRLSGTEQWKLQMFIWIQEHQWLEILSNRFVNLSYKTVDKPRAYSTRKTSVKVVSLWYQNERSTEWYRQQ